MDPNSSPQQPANLANTPLKPTWIGYVHDTGSALCLMEAVLRGLLPHCKRRPHDKEREQCIRSGHVFIYEEGASGIKRWTDGRNWSPSRIVGNFLVYREVTPKASTNNGSGQKKKVAKKTESRAVIRKSPGATGNKSPSGYAIGVGDTSKDIKLPSGNVLPYEGEFGGQKLLGSLTDTYNFKPGGLVKRTMSFHVGGKNHHMVMYTDMDDYLSGKFRQVFQDGDIRDCFPRDELFQQTWRLAYHTDLGPFEEQHHAHWAALQQQHEREQGHQPWVMGQEAVYHPEYGMAPHGMAPHGMAPHSMAPHGMAPQDMQTVMHDQPHGLTIGEYPVHDPHSHFAPEYPHGAYALIGDGDEQPVEMDEAAPRTSIVMGHPVLQAQAQTYGAAVPGAFQSPVMSYHHSPDMAYSAHEMTYPAHNGAYPTHNGAYAGQQNGAYEGEGIIYPEHRVAYQEHAISLQDGNQYLPPGPEGDYPPPSDN
ncbi:Gti1/Pac2 family-domain-containing protein [Triangularia setosa]|uniref:Gti1/Pac2 family-domain-containing protein n=1 Tax=Triangularia setosa TaxID=2587417 RepID=A0AAN6WDY9_9PEZI|nr:Gti1/Pac2 family-domain-containing protein [Podospora setosa]